MKFNTSLKRSIIFFLAIMVPVSAFTIFNLFNEKESVQKVVKAQLEKEAKHSAHLVDTYINSYKDSMKSVASNNFIINFFRKPTSDQRRGAYETIYKVQNTLWGKSFHMFLVNTTGEIVLSPYHSEPTDTLYGKKHDLKNKGTDKYFHISTPVVYRGETLGHLVSRLSKKSIFSLVGKGLYLSNPKGEGMVVKAQSSILPISIYAWKSKEEIYSSVAANTKKVIIFLAALTFIVAISSYFLAVGPSGPVEEMVFDYENLSQSIHSGSQIMIDNSKGLMSNLEHISSAVSENRDHLERAKLDLDHEVKEIGESLKVSREAKDQSHKGKSSIHKVIATIDELNGSNKQVFSDFKNVTEKVKEISDFVSQIQDKTKVINEIVFQTKLLSFNASVEAARAGEAGKGFAVVAEEVGNLANLSGNSAVEINELISVSLEKVDSIISEVEVIVDQSITKSEKANKESMQTVEESEQTFSKAYEIIEKLHQRIERANNTARKTYNSINMVSESVGKLESITSSSKDLFFDTSEGFSKQNEHTLKLVGLADKYKKAV